MSVEPDHRLPVTAINVTPMADVMITLPTIFMVRAPRFGRDDHVRLPEAGNGLQVAASLPYSRKAGHEAGAQERLLMTAPRSLEQ